MNNHENEIAKSLDAMPLAEARKAIAQGAFGATKSPDQAFASLWLSVREAETRDQQAKETSFNARSQLLWCIASAISAIVAAILAFIGLFH